MEEEANKLFLVDSHAHIYGEKFNKDIEQIIADAKTTGIQAIVNVSENIQSAMEIQDLYLKYPILKPAIGLHPIVDNRCVKRDELLSIEKLLRESKNVVAIGECSNCGLDFSPYIIQSSEHKDDQIFVFQQQIQLSKELQLPLNVHSRSAGRQAIELLKENNAKHVLMHCFDGNQKFVKMGIDCGFYFSISASIVRQEQTKKLAELVPLDRILLETDSPALHPIKGPGLRNEPKNLLIACEEVAKIKKTTTKEIAKWTTENAKKLFPNIINL